MVLDTYAAGTLAEALLECVDDLGFPPEEAIPGLIVAAIKLAQSTRNPTAALDEAAEILADGGI